MLCRLQLLSNPKLHCQVLFLNASSLQAAEIASPFKANYGTLGLKRKKNVQRENKENVVPKV
jgi:hypothetical protein